MIEQHKRKSIIFLLAAQTGDKNKTKENCDEYTINCCDASGNTALHLACKHEKSEIVKFLLTQPKIAIDKKNKNNQSAIDLANHSISSLFKLKPFENPHIFSDAKKESNTDALKIGCR